MKQDSKRLTSIIIAGALFVFAIIIYMEFIVPAYGQLQTEKGQEESQQALYSNEKQVATQVQSLITTYKGEASSTQAVNLALPVGQNVADALAQIYGIAQNTGFNLTASGISVQNVSQSTAKNSTIATAASSGSIVRPVGKVTLQLTGQASYESFINFLQGIENNIRIFDVTGVSITPGSNGNSKAGAGTQDFFSYTLTVVTYYQAS